MRRSLLGSLALLPLLAWGCGAAPDPPPGAAPEPSAADEVAVWLRGQAIETEHGRVWPTDADAAESVSLDLYDGTPGVVLFFLHRHRVTDGADPRDLEDAIAGADHLLATLPEEAAAPGLYVGVAGVGFTLDEAHRITGEERFAAGAAQCVTLLAESATRTERGITWDGTTDVISGSAGAGLWLLDRSRRAGDRRALSLAGEVGRALLAAMEPTDRGARWPMAPGYERWMPNFSHGTAGVAYFLLELAEALGETEPERATRLRDAAIAGAAHLRAIRGASGLVRHHAPGGEDLFYLGWCHGPPGTARLFWRLWEVTGDASYRDDVERMANALRACGLPDARTPGYWNNVGVCCGAAGVAAFLDDLGRATGDPRDADLVRRLTEDLVARGTRDTAGLRWVQAEHRVRPELLVAQTGLMQGAAGVGLWLLRAHAGGEDRLRWPDSPF
ncbi:MAG: lanthionine synthetase LanC family protein [Planctomycetota bacterium]